ncbi:MAG: hypothetical protein R6X02_13435 [Enhygromyxa sp.]
MRRTWLMRAGGCALTAGLLVGCFRDPGDPSDGLAGETEGEAETLGSEPDLPDDDEPSPDLPDDDDDDDDRPSPDLPGDDQPTPDLPDEDGPTCGDGVVDPGEDCDDGNEVDADGCNVDCRSSGAELFSIRVEPEPLSPGARTRAAAFGAATFLDELVIVGYQEFALADVAQKQRDGWIARYDGAGTQLWESHVGQPTANEELAAVEISGPLLFVSGTLDGRGQLLKVSGFDGSLEHILVDLPEQRIHDHAMRLGADAIVVGEQAGHAEARLYDQLFGPPIWEHDLFGFGFAAYYGVAIADDLEYAYVCGELASDGLGQQGWLLRYDLAAGDYEWTKTFGQGSASANAVAVADEDVIVAGWLPSANQQRDAYVARFASDGALVWERTHDGGLGQTDGALGVAVDSRGNVIVGGSSTSVAEHGQDPWVLKLDGEGNELWSRQLSEAPGSGTIIDVAVYHDDRIALVGVDGLAAVVYALAP